MSWTIGRANRPITAANVCSPQDTLSASAYISNSASILVGIAAHIGAVCTTWPLPRIAGLANSWGTVVSDGVAKVHRA
jgi:hypothetical protein